MKVGARLNTKKRRWWSREEEITETETEHAVIIEKGQDDVGCVSGETKAVRMEKADRDHRMKKWFNYYPFIFWTSEYPSWQNACRIYKKMETPTARLRMSVPCCY